MSRPAGHALAFGATAVGLIIGYLLKEQCAANAWADSFQYRRLCYNDLQPLFAARGVSAGAIPYVDVRYEYPVLTGLFMALMGKVLQGLDALGLANFSDPGYLRVSSIFLAPFALMVTAFLRPFVPASRLMLWAVGTPLILYSFHNWDLIAVAFAAWGVALYERSRHSPAGAALAAGASAKLYPAFLLPGALIDRWGKRDRRGAFHMAAWFAAVYAAINVPVILLANGVPRILSNPRWAEITQGVELRDPEANGWMAVWLFHADRYPDFGTVWYWIAHHGNAISPAAWWQPGQAGYRDFVSITSLILFVLGAGVFFWVGWRRREDPSYSIASTGLGVLCVFLLTSKVHSPQYALWVVPLVVLVNVPWPRVVAYFAADLAVYVSGFYWFTVFEEHAPAWKGVFEASVLLRALALAWMAAAAFRAGRVVVEGSEAAPSAAPATN